MRVYLNINILVGRRFPQNTGHLSPVSRGICCCSKRAAERPTTVPTALLPFRSGNGKYFLLLVATVLQFDDVAQGRLTDFYFHPLERVFNRRPPVLGFSVYLFIYCLCAVLLDLSF